MGGFDFLAWDLRGCLCGWEPRRRSEVTKAFCVHVCVCVCLLGGGGRFEVEGWKEARAWPGGAADSKPCHNTSFFRIPT